MFLNVVGSHEVSLRPERGTVHLTLGFEGTDRATIAPATGQLATGIRTDLESLQQAGQLERFTLDAPTVRSWHPWASDGTEQPLRHAAEIAVRATFVDFAALSDACARWTETDGVRIDQVEWTLTDQTRTSLEDEVLTQAILQATRRARVMAQAAGATEVTVVEISDPGTADAGLAGAPMMAMSRKQSGGEGVELSPGDVVLRAEVKVRLEA